MRNVFHLLSVAGLLAMMAGPVTAAPQFVQAFERDADSRLDFRTFNTLSDLTSGSGAFQGTLDLYSSAWSLGGLAHDGTQFVQVFERDADSRLDFRTFATLADLTSGNGTFLGTLDLYSSAWSLGGLAHDGTQFVQVFERDSDSRLDFRTFATLADLISGSGTFLGTLDLYSSAWSLGGLAYEKETAGPIPEPSILVLLGLGALVLSRRRRRSR
ncbi:MAG: PEP-CTERM sorting domain-containing protein [Planctomycetota bacterium]|jgi:hypothetical protein